MRNYEDVLNRLSLRRKQLGLTQSKLASAVGIEQEQYSYIENGHVLISGCLLMKFADLGFNIDELITGKAYDFSSCSLENSINSIVSGDTRDFILKLLSEIILKDSRNSPSEAPNSVLLLEALNSSWDNFSMLRFVRSRLNLNQIDMSELLGLGIKKYRALERESIYPDAEILLFLYDISGCQPSLFMNMPDRKLQIIKNVWENLSFEKQAALLECIACLVKYAERLNI